MLSIRFQLRSLLVIFTTFLVFLSAATWYSLTWIRTTQDDGATIAAEANEAANASALGARLYRIIADSVINRDLDVSRRDWAAALADERAAIDSLKTWIVEPDQAAALKAAITGVMAATSMEPAGTPHCFRLKIRDRRLAGVFCASRWLPAGVTGPCPMPQAKAEITSATGCAMIESASASPHRLSPAWSTRMPP